MPDKEILLQLVFAKFKGNPGVAVLIPTFCALLQLQQQKSKPMNTIFFMLIIFYVAKKENDPDRNSFLKSMIFCYYHKIMEKGEKKVGGMLVNLYYR